MRDGSSLEAAINLARCFGPIWAQTPAKTGYRGTSGSKDATTDAATIRRWWTEHPEAVPALMTGKASGVVALDVDVKNGRNGLDTLEAMGIAFHPATPTAHTPSGGLHLFFKCPSHRVLSSTDKIGPGLEVKGDGAWITLPPGPGRFWDPHLGPNTPLASMPSWMVIVEPAERHASGTPPCLRMRLTRYGEAALDSAVKCIREAPQGQQASTLNREAYGIGQLVGGGVLPADLALESLMWAARKMHSYNAREPWRDANLKRKVRDAFADGLRRPRAVAHAP